MEKMALESEGEVALPEQLLPQLQHLQSQLQLTAGLDPSTDEGITVGSVEDIDSAD